MARKTELKRELDLLMTRAATLNRQIENLADEPVEPEWDPDYYFYNVVQFRKRYAPLGQLYTFAAIQAGPNRWTLTGRETRYLTWDQLLNFMDGDGTDTDPDLHVATDWKEIDRD